MTSERFTIPPRFFENLGDDEAMQIMMTSRLNAEQCARLWRMLDRQDKPPTSLTLSVSRADVMKIWPPREKSR
jgi:hypothetical protein